MTTKRLIIHVGYHKTGSSSVQKWLQQHAEILSPHLYCFNLADGGSNTLKFAAMNWLRGHATRDDFVRHCRTMAAEIHALSQPVICITDESLLGMPLGFSNGDYAETEIYPQARSIVDVIAQEFSDFDLTIVAVERDADNWLRSVHNQMYKQGCVAEDFDGYLSRFEPMVDWPALRGEIEAGLAGRGRLQTLAFEEELSHPLVSGMGIVGLLDLPPELLAQCRLNLEQVNPSVPLQSKTVSAGPLRAMILGGSNSMIAKGWVNLMRRDYAALIVADNLSVGACTTTMGLYRLLSQPSRPPGMPVIWEYGVNEYNHMVGGQPLSSLLRHIEWLLQICIREHRPFLPVLMRNKSQTVLPHDDVYVHAVTDLFRRYGLSALDCTTLLRVMARGDLDANAWYSDNAHYDTATELPRRVAEAVLLALPSAQVPISPADRAIHFDPLEMRLALPTDPRSRLENSIINCAYAAFDESPELEITGRVLAAIIATSGSGPDIRISAGDHTLGYYATQVAHGPQVPAQQLRQLVFDTGQGGFAVTGDRLRLSVDESHQNPTVQTMYRKGPKPEILHGGGLVAILCECSRGEV
ncbi:hypothetical protein SAMN05444004_101549 [Jannaschia faecimaris]|uniref:Uncharacterized protein n=1 Tax=Jannaschia faecimaris TaxID=1244108 RepID=A0A1H3K985_9RHOB|nr:hypothetical protein [Jannaschia faecimaris]SDY48345.1 hypothetical protein SAMN05444004_101549 [Jannaschia faecimaris]